MSFFPKNVDSQFLIRVIRDQVGPEEREFFERWLEESEENKEEFSTLVLLWDKFKSPHLPPLPDQSAQWEKIRKSVFNNPSLSHARKEMSSFIHENHIHGNVKRRRSEHLTWLYRIAAVIVISFSIYLSLASRTEEQTGKISEVSRTAENIIKYYTISTAKGERATLNLADGSVIQLNSDSKLKYPNYFGTDSREVEFTGEGYFRISKDKSRPFRVKCSNTITEVTGTEFNIKNRANDLSIAVLEGSVRTFSRTGKKGIPVIQGEMITLNPSGNFSRPVKADLSLLTAWRENKISFSKTPLAIAAEELERCYKNIEIIIVSDSLNQKTITGIFDTNSLDDILSIFSLTMDIRVSKKGHKIYFE